jgi:acyl-CoA reductase-like NAD-dependent aldehyde dehydrogenase
MLIDGKWHAGEDNEALKVLDKFTGEVIATVPVATRGDVARATEGAGRAFPAWAATPAHRRSKILRRTAELLEERRETLAATISREAGKAWRHARGEVDRSVETFTFAAEEAKRIHGETIPLDASPAGEHRMGFYLRSPIGVVAAITPFNFPLNPWRTRSRPRSLPATRSS